MFDEAFYAAERGGALPYLHVGGGGDGTLLAAFGADGHKATEAALHLFRSDRMTRVVGEAGVEDVFHQRVAAEVLRDGQGVRGGGADARIERAHTAQEQPRLEGAEHGAGLDADPLDGF